MNNPEEPVNDPVEPDPVEPDPVETVNDPVELDSVEPEGPEDRPEGATDTSVYVRRSRTPTLGFWVALVIVVPAVVALVISPFLDFVDLGGVVNFVLLTAVFVGVPLAAVAAGIDAFVHRSSGRRSR
ncbi:hypothetical protein [Brachybacterium sp. FME24]|uniref:hypothetical protein n=1 Tax=Brachybacterium sp. FME24 TaxID=2742605 RepID=UPI001868C364|nr:hypothetical protein [Brachybacterium sp. FME24]